METRTKRLLTRFGSTNPFIVRTDKLIVSPLLAFIILGLAVVSGFAQVSEKDVFPLASAEKLWGPNYKSQATVQAEESRMIQSVGGDTRTRLLNWNMIAVDSTGIDHTPVAPGENRVFGEQIGPVRSARAMAIVHIAIFDAINAITGGFQSYTNLGQVQEPNTYSVDAAIAQAAHDTLVALFPSQRQRFDELLFQDMAEIGRVASELQRNRGIALGQRSATFILGRRTNDGSQIPEPRYGIEYIAGNAAGVWRQDPISQIPLVIGGRWQEVRPFVMQSVTQFRLPPAPALSSAAYRTAFNEVKRLGGDGITTPTERNAQQTVIGIFWAYDATPALCAPPRLYNQVTVQVANQTGTTSVIQLARLLALVNVAMADAGVASWDSKFFYKYWRPITGIRESDPGTGPSGTGDGNPNTIGDPTFVPLGAPASNLTGPNFTPPFPAYPSGHATFGGALFQILRRFYGRDNVSFAFVSDEFNGITKDNNGVVRPLIPKSYSSFSQAETENGQSRIYLGIHWQFDATSGITQGRNVANFVFNRTFLPR